MAKKITIKMLKELDACSDEVKRFEKEFPQGLIPNENGIARAATCGLPINWCYTNLLGFSEEQVEDISELDNEIYPSVEDEGYWQNPSDLVTDVALLPILFREQGWLD